MKTDEVEEYKFTSTYRREILFFLLVSLLSLLFISWSKWVSQIPLDVPISLLPAAEVEENITVRLSEGYGAELCFVRKGLSQEESDKLRELVGNSYTNSSGSQVRTGVVIPISISLYDREGKKLLRSGVTSSIGIDSWGSDCFYRRINNFSISEKGNYKIKIKILKDIKEFEGVKVRVVLHGNPKLCSSLVCGLLFWGSVFNTLILWPLVFVSLSFLIVAWVFWMIGYKEGIFWSKLPARIFDFLYVRILPRRK